ncbi:MAG: SDR family NAD(P)-dependent oxidoreductase, partial [Burkholderiales bacterium]
ARHEAARHEAATARDDAARPPGEPAGRTAPCAPRAIALRLDVRDEPAFRAAWTEAEARLGPIDVLVNDAAIMGPSSPWTTTLEQWDAVMATNLRGTFVGCRIAGAAMRARGRGGRIVNLSSYAGRYPSRASGLAYAASKAGIDALTRGFAMELAPDRVTVNAVAPSAIEGPQWDAVEPARRDALVAQVPVGRPGRADEVSAVVLWLASDAAAYVTGQVIDANGGRGMR